MMVVEPQTFERAAAVLAQAAAAGQSVQVRGGGTKLGWGRVTPDADVELCTARLDHLVEHNAGDLTAVLEAGVPLARAQEAFAAHGQRLALDPPTGAGHATIGGIVATGDSGPLRHRYGAPRDLVLGLTVGLSDGTIARSGAKVIKNVAGYDLAKLFAGSFGTLGVILDVSVRLHPLPAHTATAQGATAAGGALAAAATMLARAPLELDALDVVWSSGAGNLLARCGGAEARRRAERAATEMRAAGMERVEVVDEDDDLWERQRAAQRARNRSGSVSHIGSDPDLQDDLALVRVSTRPSQLPQVIAATQRLDGSLVGRAALGTSYVRVAANQALALRQSLPADASSVVLDAPPAVRRETDPWGAEESPALVLMRRIKRRFDPASTCNPGVFVGGI